MANLLVLDPLVPKIRPNEHFYGCPLTKPTAIPLYYDYINHLNALPLSTRLIAYPTTALVSSIHRGASCHDAPLNVWTKYFVGLLSPKLENRKKVLVGSFCIRSMIYGTPSADCQTHALLPEQSHIPPGPY